MRLVAVSVENIRWLLIDVVVHRVPKHDLFLFFQKKGDYKCEQKSNVFAFPDIKNVALEVATGGFPYGGAKCKPITKTKTSQ